MVRLYKDNIDITMRLLVFVVAFFSSGLGAPAPNLALDKRRESTPEILNLEQELKKAAGENKQYFSNPNGQPIPQIDGLDVDNEELQKSAEPGNPMGSEEAEMENSMKMGYPMDTDVADLENQRFQNPVDMEFPMQGDLSDQDRQDFEPSMNMRYPMEAELENENLEPTNARYPLLPNNDDVDPRDSGSQEYMAMWKLFKQHPEFMEDVYEYLNGDEDSDQMNQIQSNYMKPNTDKRGDVGVYAYPGQNDILEKISPDDNDDEEQHGEEDGEGLDDDDSHSHEIDEEEDSDEDNSHNNGHGYPDIDDEDDEEGDDEEDEEALLHLPNAQIYNPQKPYDGDIAVPPHAM